MDVWRDGDLQAEKLAGRCFCYSINISFLSCNLVKGITMDSLNDLDIIKKTLVNGIRMLFSMILINVFVLSGAAFAQEQITVSGHVIDGQGDPLPGATILVEGTTIGTTTDLEGYYSLDVASNGVLVVSYVGFERRRITVNNRQNIDIILTATEGFLDEVVIIGYGETSRRMLTTSISSLGSERIEGLPVPSVTSAIQGKIAGVRISHGSGGEPGALADIRIRGGSSIGGGNSPLILIDGLERALIDVNPNDVASIQVLKDAASTAIYGSRASNGVVLITTKRGQRGVSNIKFDASWGVSVANRRMDMVGAEDYLRLARIGAARTDSPENLWRATIFGVGNGPESAFSPRYLQEGESVPTGWKSMIDPVDPTQTIIFQDNDFQDIALQQALERNYTLSASGGLDNLLFSGSIGYTNTEGIAVKSQWERFSGRLNVDFFARDNLKFEANVNTTLSTSDTYRNFTHMFNRSLWLAPTARVYMEDGSLAHGYNATMTNPLWYTDIADYQDERRRTQLGSALVWDINQIRGLRATLRGTYYFHQNEHERFERANVHDSSRDTRYNLNDRRKSLVEGFISYTRTIRNDHNLNLMAGSSYETDNLLRVRARAFGGATDLIKTLNAAPEMREAYTDREGEAMLGAFSRLSYNYDNRYLAAASIRRDASSRFAPDNRVGYFPAGSAAWVISEESFFPEFFASMVKIRASYGLTGNVVSGLYTPFGEYAVGQDYGGEAGTFPVDMPNFSLQWESTTQRDLGIDVGLFNDRVVMAFDVYDRVTRDLLFNTPLPRETGFNNIQQNVGSVKFYGWEFEIRSDIIDNSLFNWRMDFNISYNMNEVLSLPDNGRIQNRIGGIYNEELGVGIGGIAEGERLGAIIGFQSAYIIDNWDQANNAHYDEFAAGFDPETGRHTPGRKFPGDMEWVDQTGDGRITQYDQVVLGYNEPHTWGGISNRLTYGNFVLNLHLDFAIGHSIMDATKRRADALAVGGSFAPSTDALHAWQEEGDVAAGRAKMPRIDWHDARHQSNIHRDHDRVTYRADYLSLREIMFTYKIPPRISQSFGIARASVYVQGQNLRYFTGYPIFNPEFERGSSNFEDSAEFPIPRKILGGFSMSF